MGSILADRTNTRFRAIGPWGRFLLTYPCSADKFILVMSGTNTIPGGKYGVLLGIKGHLRGNSVIFGGNYSCWGKWGHTIKFMFGTKTVIFVKIQSYQGKWTNLGQIQSH